MAFFFWDAFNGLQESKGATWGKGENKKDFLFIKRLGFGCSLDAFGPMGDMAFVDVWWWLRLGAGVTLDNCRGPKHTHDTYAHNTSCGYWHACTSTKELGHNGNDHLTAPMTTTSTSFPMLPMLLPAVP